MLENTYFGYTADELIDFMVVEKEESGFSRLYLTLPDRDKIEVINIDTLISNGTILSSNFSIIVDSALLFIRPIDPTSIGRLAEYSSMVSAANTENYRRLIAGE